MRQQQSSFQQFPQMHPHEEPAKRVKISFKLKAVHKHREGWVERRIAKILQTGPSPRLGAKRSTVQKP
jgi:hypothetical protein